MAEFAYEGSRYDTGTGDLTLKKKDKTYIDISLAFTPSPVTNDLTLLVNERAINNSIKNIVMTLPGEVAFFRDFGSRTNEYLFDFIDDISAGLLEQEIERAIKFCEPRVSFDVISESDPYSKRNMDSVQSFSFGKDYLGVTVEAKPEQNEYEVTVKYRIVGGEQIYRVAVLLTPTR